MSDTALPTAHLNGTSKQELVDQQAAVIDAAYLLVVALKAATPHSRDYYPQGPDAWRVASDQHTAIVHQIMAIQERALTIAEHVASQESGR